ncbi:hypothetical protein [Devriesea agamarum]|uniref:hypothetical protein n=1 Tax=Devriesea agamarum TaxID=472569 RepID=UPI00071E181E|nr:hypothetical protein [Devriesea agamarum]
MGAIQPGTRAVQARNVSWRSALAMAAACVVTLAGCQAGPSTDHAPDASQQAHTNTSKVLSPGNSTNGTQSGAVPQPNSVSHSSPGPDQADAGRGSGQSIAAYGVHGDEAHRLGGTSASDQRSPVKIPSSWKGTILAEPGALRTSDVKHSGALSQVLIHGSGTSLTPKEYMATELSAPIDLDGRSGKMTCTHTITLGGPAQPCTLTIGGQTLNADVLLAQTGYGNRVVLSKIRGAHDDGARFAIPSGTQVFYAPAVGLSTSASTGPARMTRAIANRTARNGVLLAWREDGQVPAHIDTRCKVLDRGQHLLCTIRGTEGGGGDGTWYATYQPFLDQRPGYVFAKLP